MAIEFVDLLDSFNQKYDNATSGLTADNAQDAIDELAADLAGFSGDMAISTQVDQLTVAAAVNTLYVVTTGATNGTCTVNLPTPTSAGARLGVIFHAENTDTDKVVISPAASDEIDGSTANIELTAPGEYLYLRADGDGTNWYTYSSTSSGYFMSGFYPGAPAASAKMMVHVFPVAVDVPSGMTGSQGTAETAATAQTDFDVQKNGVSAGTMRFAAAATTATFIMATATSFSPGDKLQLIAPATPDSTLADIAWSFKGTKT